MISHRRKGVSRPTSTVGSVRRTTVSTLTSNSSVGLVPDRGDDTLTGSGWIRPSLGKAVFRC